MLFGSKQIGAPGSMAPPMLPPRALFGKPHRDNILAHSRPAPSQVEGTAGQGIAADPQAEEEQFRAMVENMPAPARASALALRERVQGQEAEPGESGGHWSVENFAKLRQAIPERPRLPVPANDGPLGGSMRQPFDYDAAMKALAGNQKKIGPWRIGAAILADTIALQQGTTPFAGRALSAQRNAQQERLQAAAEQLMKWRYQDYSRQNEADLRAANPFTIGRDRVMYDPASGQANVIYDGAEDFELYAKELGLEPGSEEYFQAVEDFVLRSSGPSAYERDVQLDDHRTGNDRSLENLRYGNRAGLENLRQGNRRGMVDYRNANPRPSRSGKPRVVSVKTPAEAAKLKPGTIYRGPDGVVRER